MTHASGEHEGPQQSAGASRWQQAEAEAAAADFVASAYAAAPLGRELTAGDLGTRRRRVVLPLVLFVATCGSTFLAGAMSWQPEVLVQSSVPGQLIADNWRQGLVYMAAVIGILLTHEMGHFVQTVRYGVHASLPFFIPVPFVPTGTMGAVIGMEGSRADRKQLFDIGISGPLAGLVVAMPIIWFGIRRAHPVNDPTSFVLGDPLIFRLLAHYLRPDIAANAVLSKNEPLLMAGWVGMLITGLNMLPVSQLDGGHVIYGLFGPSSRIVARGFMILAILFVVFGEHYSWISMLVLVILIGVDHPPTRDDNVPLGWWRRILGLASLVLPLLCFAPVRL